MRTRENGMETEIPERGQRMRNPSGKEKVICGLIAAVVLGCLAAGTFRFRADRVSPVQYQVVLFGDSILGMWRDDTGIAAKLETRLDKSVFNSAFGGTCVGRGDRDSALTDMGDSLSLAALTKAVAAGDFGVQQTVRVRENERADYDDKVDLLERVDFSAVELVIMDGMNDIISGVPIRNDADPSDEYTFAGALYSSVENLRAKNPDMRILLVTPTFYWFLEEEADGDVFNAGYGTAEDYIRAEKDVAETLGVELIDAYHGLYVHESWEDWKTYTLDGIHPNEYGRELIANLICEYLRNNPQHG